MWDEPVGVEGHGGQLSWFRMLVGLQVVGTQVSYQLCRCIFGGGSLEGGSGCGGSECCL